MLASELVNDAKFENVEKTYKSSSGIFIFDLLQESRISNFICDFKISCNSHHICKFKIPDTTFICSDIILKSCNIPIKRHDIDTYAIKLKCDLLMKHPSYCSHFRLQVYNHETNSFKNFTNYTFEFYKYKDNCLVLTVNECRRDKNIIIPFDEELGECRIRILAEECCIPFNGSLFNLNNLSSQFNINYLPLCWMCFSRSPLIIILLDENNDDEIKISYRRGIFSELSNDIYTKKYSNSILTTNVGSELFGIYDGKGYFIKSL